MQLSKVVLPAPFGPMMPSTSPCSTSKVTPARALTPPNRLLRSRTASKLIPPTLPLPRKGGRELLASCAGLAQGLPEISERELASTAEEVDHAARNEDDAHGEQDPQADLGEDRAGAAPGQPLDDQLERDRAGDGPQHGARPPDRSEERSVGQECRSRC